MRNTGKDYPNIPNNFPLEEFLTSMHDNSGIALDYLDRACRLIKQENSYGELPSGNEAAHVFYYKAQEALWKFGLFIAHLHGKNHRSIKAMVVLLNWMLSDDYQDLAPEHAVMCETHELDYADYKQASGVIEQYLQENRRTH